LADKKKKSGGSPPTHDLDSSDHSVILTDQKQHQVITRMAHEIVEKNRNL